jgi:hypothetical protein
MKTMIEVDIPQGRSIAEAIGAVKQFFDPDWMASWWHISDVHTIANESGEDEADEITDEQAREVLRLMNKNHDSNIGINWETIDVWIDIVKNQSKEKA